jgi:hypothetical protein
MLYRSGVAAWAEAKAQGEEAFLTAHVLSAAPDARSPARFALLALAHRHPHRLEDVYRAALARPAMSTEWITEAIGHSALPDTEKRRILEAGASLGSLEQCTATLRALRPLDPAAYARLLVGFLDTLRQTPTEAYWRAPESEASRLAVETGDARVWAALLRAAKRADVGLRMELLGRLGDARFGERQRRERLALLAAFLDDAAVPDTTSDPKMWGGPRVTRLLPGASVGDVAAKAMAQILGMPAEPTRAWTRADWDAVRAEVKRRLAALP